MLLNAWVRRMTVHLVSAVLALAVVTTAGIGLRPAAVVFATQRGSHESGRMELHDDLLVRVEQQVPGFGGMFVDREGRLAVYLLDMSQLGAARAAIEAVFGTDSIPAAGVRAMQGQYVVSQLKAWSEMATGDPRVAWCDGCRSGRGQKPRRDRHRKQVQYASRGTCALGDRDPARRGHDPSDRGNSSGASAARFTPAWPLSRAANFFTPSSRST